MRVHMCVRVYVNVCVYVGVHLCVYVYMNACVYVCVNVCAYVCIPNVEELGVQRSVTEQQRIKMRRQSQLGLIRKSS